MKSLTDKISLYSLKEIFITDYAPLLYIVEDIFLDSGLFLFFGAPKIGKSFFLLQFLHNVSYGRSFLGQMVNKVAKSLYIALEDTPRSIKTRLIKMGLNTDTDFVSIAFDWPSGSEAFSLLIQMIESDPELKIIAIDTLARFSYGRNDRSYQEVSDYLSNFKRIAQKYNVCIILVHHSRKEKDYYDEFNNVNGNMAYNGVCDTTLQLSRERFQQKGTLSLISRQTEDRKFEITFDPDSCLWGELSEEVHEPSSAERRELLAILKKHGEMTPSQIQKILPHKKAKNISNLLASTKKEGFVTNGSARGFWKATEVN